MSDQLTNELDVHELRKTATERRKRLDDIAADALGAAADEIDRLRSQLAAPGAAAAASTTFRDSAIAESHFRFEDATYGVAEAFVDGALWAHEGITHHPAITTAAELDALPTGAVIRGLGPYGGLWLVTDDEDYKRYASPSDNSFHMGETLLRQGGPLELLWSPES